MQRLLRKLPCGVATSIVLLLILYATLTSNPIPNQEYFIFFEGFDKIVHFLMFFCLIIVLLFDYQKKIFPKTAQTQISLGLMGGAMAFGALTEVLQEIMGLGRTEDINDFIADGFGAVIGWLIWYYLLDKYFRKVFKAGKQHRYHHHSQS